MNKKVCCIVVTYNRSKYLKVLIQSLFNQTYKISGLILINNNSTDDTIDYLKEQNIIDDEKQDTINCSNYEDVDIYFYNSSTNNGGSSGFAKGFEIAQTLDFDYFWVMDDDVKPELNCLEKAISHFDNEHGVVVPKRVGEGFTDFLKTKYSFNNPFVHFKKLKFRKIKMDNTKEFYDIKTMTFEGPIFNSDIIKKVGIPNKEYFIFCDDYDYAFRCLEVTKIRYVTTAIINRQIPLVKAKDSNSLWRLYYGIRNATLLDLRYSSNRFFGRWRVLNNQLHWFLVNFKHRNKIERKLVKQAFRDGLKNKVGKTIEPGSI